MMCWLRFVHNTLKKTKKRPLLPGSGVTVLASGRNKPTLAAPLYAGYLHRCFSALRLPLLVASSGLRSYNLLSGRCVLVEVDAQKGHKRSEMKCGAMWGPQTHTHS